MKTLNARHVGKLNTVDQTYVGRPSKWGNPFVIGTDGTREEVVDRYRDYVQSSELIESLDELVGKNLVCWCSPKLCHADVLLELVEERSRP